MSPVDHCGGFWGSSGNHVWQIAAHLERRGTPIGPLDCLIAAHALSLDAILVTHNEREFSRAPELKVENWV
ncbi:MAG: hypothetical protein DCC55_35735 [Chloroflexi bacterium]|nr:MAG: hypothetical protein DCC55_35735 [Chloroflexota bacterium]